MAIKNLTVEVYRDDDESMNVDYPWRFRVCDNAGNHLWECYGVHCPNQHHAARKGARFLKAIASDRDRLLAMGVDLAGVDDLADLMQLIIRHLKPKELGGTARTSWEVAWTMRRPAAERAKLSKCCREPIGEAVIAMATGGERARATCPGCGVCGCDVKHIVPRENTMAAKLPHRDELMRPVSAFYVGDDS